jgi:hypothetical protein
LQHWFVSEHFDVPPAQHDESFVHAAPSDVAQQTPLTQEPPQQSTFAVHACPGAALQQVPLLHLPWQQSASAMHAAPETCAQQTPLLPHCVPEQHSVLFQQCSPRSRQQLPPAESHFVLQHRLPSWHEAPMSSQTPSLAFMNNAIVAPAAISTRFWIFDACGS